MDLYQSSIEIIRQFQSPEGAYVASPNFSIYHYSWMRDSSYIAYAMDLAGEHNSARRYYLWAANVIEKHKNKIFFIKQALNHARPLNDENFLFTRYTLAGSEDSSSKWGNFQYDGYGTWLWAVCEHYLMTGDRKWLLSVEESLNLIVEYLQTVWRLPNFDCWEENPDLLHSYSIASAYFGLRSVFKLIQEGALNLDPITVKRSMEEMRAFIARYGVINEKLTKHIRPDLPEDPVRRDSADASLLGAVLPAEIFPMDHPIMMNTITSIQKELVSSDGGVYRYRNDTYYGGGQWILLTAWLGWVESKIGQDDLAVKRLIWIEKQADENGWLPEQVSNNLLAPQFYAEWLKNWGGIAKPLLWSHAMYIILFKTLNLS